MPGVWGVTYPPTPTAWKPATLALTPGADGHHGTMTLDGVVVHVRGWKKGGDGVVVFDCQFESDGWVERWAEGKR